LIIKVQQLMINQYITKLCPDFFSIVGRNTFYGAVRSFIL